MRNCGEKFLKEEYTNEFEVLTTKILSSIILRCYCPKINDETFNEIKLRFVIENI